MDDQMARIALVSRCPDISDGAKVTMVEILFHVNNGRIPSLNELKRIRNCSRSTVQLHFKELLDLGVAKRILGQRNKVFFRVQDKKLLRLNGLDSLTEVEKWMVNKEAAETSNPSVVKSLMLDPKDWQPKDVCNYFRLLGKRKGEESCKKQRTISPKQHALARRLLWQFGGENLKIMLEYFVHNYRRMDVSYTLNSVFKKRNSLIK